MLFAMSRLDMDAKARASYQEAFGNELMGRNQYSSAEVERHKMSDDELAKEAGKIKGFMDTNEDRIRLMLPGEVLFDSASADLKPSAAASFQETLDMLKQIPNKVVIEGHTDDLPIFTRDFSSNWELSLARAESVVNYMIASGIPAERICMAGYGEFKPMVANTDEVNRAKNRRIEITIIKKKQ